MVCRTMGMGKSALSLLVLLASGPLYAAAPAEDHRSAVQEANLEKAVVVYSGAGRCGQSGGGRFEKRSRASPSPPRATSASLDFEIDRQLGHQGHDGFSSNCSGSGLPRWDRRRPTPALQARRLATFSLP